jgi:cellulose biosynthesis protein BcsQ
MRLAYIQRKERVMKAIAVFNNKGGVGKTTLTCNLASYLCRYHKKSVLIVDADPQCNATQLLFDENEVFSIYNDPSSFTIDTVLQPLQKGKGYSEKVVTRYSPRFEVDVLVGHPKLSLTEDLLARDWSSGLGGDERGLRTSFVFTELLSRLKKYDFVFFDVGPSLGAINRTVLIGSDFFLTPMSIDVFSLKAIENINEAVSDWKKKLKVALSNLGHNLEEIDRERQEFNIKFCGYVTQQYKAKTDASGRKVAVQAYEQIMKRVEPLIQKNFIRSLQPESKSVNYNLGTIPQLHSLVPMAQSARAPIFDLRSTDGVRGAHFAKVEDSKNLFKEIASRFVSNVETLSNSR